MEEEIIITNDWDTLVYELSEILLAFEIHNEQKLEQLSKLKHLIEFKIKRHEGHKHSTHSFKDVYRSL